MSSHNDSDAWWIAREENANKIWYALVSICIVLVVIDFIYHGFVHEKHGYFVFETAVAFHAMYGFGAFIFVVMIGKELRRFIMRDEDYYDVPYTPRVDDHGHGDHHGAEHHDEHSHDSSKGGEHHV